MTISEFPPIQQIVSSTASSSHDHQHLYVSDSDPSAAVQDVSPAVQPEYHQSDLQQDISQVTMNDHHNMDIPPSMSNQSNIHIQKVSETAGPGIFLDICSGVNHPLSSAILQAGGSVCTFDILIRSEDNLLNDESYEALLRLSCSRQVRYGSGSPSCCEYSRLKLKPGGPKALRTLEHMDGIPGLTFAEKTRLQESAIMLVRTITCLRLIYLAGGHCHLEQPTNAMSWMEPETQDFVAQVGIFCIVMAACAYGQSWDKSWLFSSSLEDLTQMGATCTHPRGSHESIIGTKAPDGSYKSRQTSEYPKELCQKFAQIVSPMIHPAGQHLSVHESLSLIPVKDLRDAPWSSEDGGGSTSQPDWSRPDREQPDVFQELRNKFFQHILDNKLHFEFLRHVELQNPEAPFDRQSVDMFRSFISEFLENHECIADWTVRPHQPMNLNIMSQLNFVMHDHDIDLFPSLIEGVSTGFNNDIRPSNVFGANDRPKLPETPLSVHLANWQSAEMEPDTTKRLVQEELDQGWVFEFKGTLEEAKAAYPHIAIGKLGVAFSDTRPPRLVVDSSVCGVNNRCTIPERTTLPTAKDVVRCYPLCNSNHELAGFSLDIKSAHKRICVKESEQGLLGFTLGSKIFFYRVCPFGATFSAFWWQRLGGWILRFFHQIIWLVHAAWLYVDDYFWIQRKDILPLTSTTMAMLCRCLNIPISWRKCELSHTVHWIGWTFHIAAGFIALPEPKRQKMQKYIDKLLASHRVKRPDLEKAIGLAMWITQLFPNMRIWLQNLYHDLYTLPSTNYSIDPDNWPSLAPCLNKEMTFVQQPTGTMIPIGGTLVSVRHTPTPDLDTLQQVRISDKRIWMRIKDPNSERRHVSVQSQRILQLFRQWLANSSPFVLLRPKKVWQGLAAADAFAAGEKCGIGGFIRSPNGDTHWFSERYTLQDFIALKIELDKDLQKSITSMETLAQMAIMWISCRIHPGHRIPITLPSFSDNTGAESGSNRLFSTKTPQCWFLEKLCLLSTMSGMEMDVSHIAGPINIEADGLSRWDGTDSPPHNFRASDRIRISLSDLWIQSVVPRTFPSDAYLLWRLPGSDS